MQQNIGLYGSTNFVKSTPMNYTVGVPITNPGNNTPSNLDIANEVLKTIGTLNKDQSQVDFTKDPNPLDNIIVNEVITLLNYKKIDKQDINFALEQHSKGLDPSVGFSVEQHNLLLEQAKDLEFITLEQYNQLKTMSPSFWSLNPEAYLNILAFQLSLPATTPTIAELETIGIANYILQTVRNNPEAVIDENLVKLYTERYINTILLSSEFIGYEKAQKIYSDPNYLMQILDKSTLQYFLYRVKPYLPFITDEKVNTILSWLPSQYVNIGTIFTPTQIRLMVDKELDIKNMILKTLSLTEVQNTFNELAEKFKTDFTNAFTNEKLMELIELTITNMFPIPSNEDIYARLANIYSIEIDQTKINLIEDYLSNY